MKLRTSMRWRCLTATFLSVIVSSVFAADLERAEQLLENGFADATLEIAESHLQDSPKDPRAQFLKARALGELGQPVAAIEIYEQLIHRHPDIPEAYVNLAVHYAQQGELDTARSLLLRAIDSQQSCSVAYENLSQLHAGMASLAYKQALAGSDKVVTPFQAQLVAVDRLVSQAGLGLVNGVGTGSTGVGTGSTIADVGTKIAAATLPDDASQTDAPLLLDTTAGQVLVEVASDPDAAEDVLNDVVQNDPGEDAREAPETVVADAPTIEPEPAAGSEPASTTSRADGATESRVESKPATKIVTAARELGRAADASPTQGDVNLAEAPDTVAESEPNNSSKDLALEPVEPVGVQGKDEKVGTEPETTTLSKEESKVTETKVDVATVSVNPTNDATIAAETRAVVPDATEIIVREVEQWSQDWSQRNVKGYLSHYAKDFKPVRGTLRKWKGERAKRLKSPSFIKVEVANLKVLMQKERAVVTFKQSYQSDSYGDMVNKTLVFAMRDGKWQIVSEFSQI